MKILRDEKFKTLIDSIMSLEEGKKLHVDVDKEGRDRLIYNIYAVLNGAGMKEDYIVRKNNAGICISPAIKQTSLEARIITKEGGEKE